MAARAKNINGLSNETMTKRLDDMKRLYAEHCDNVENIHVKLQKGNSKTGTGSFTVSLMPVLDCGNCSGCAKKCYDLRNDCVYSAVRNDRARNSAIYHCDRPRFWSEVEEGVNTNFVMFLRINVGGDLQYEDFAYITEMAKRCSRTTFLFFTKMYKDVNRFYDEGNRFPENVKCLFSAWPRMEMVNPYHFPESHVLWADGTTTAPEYGAVLCNGNCTACYFTTTGCVGLKHGEHVVFNAH